MPIKSSLSFFSSGVVFATLLVNGTAERPDSLPKEMPGLHNLQRVTPNLVSGSSPEGDAGFRSLQKLAIKTIISVDGGKPDVERARKFAIRYVHLPIGYSAVPLEQGRRIARAIRDLPGPVYLHCHHGKHRGPAAAAVARLCLDEKCTVEDAILFMKKAGTDPRYAGLYESVKSLNRPTKADLDRASADFPEIAKVSSLAVAMVEIDEHWENLKLVRNSGWKAPKDHPDLDPAQEASILKQHFHDLAKLPDKRQELRQWFAVSESNAREMETFLLKAKAGARIDEKMLEAAFSRLEMQCTRCHAKFRDTAAN